MTNTLPATDSMIGMTVDQGRYEIVKLIGEGGMGKVFQARQLSMNRMVALKILRATMAADEQLLARFQQEALSVSRLRHPNTITIFDYGRTENGQLFMAMELLGGRSLFNLLRDVTRMPLGRALHIMEQVIGAVGEAHKLGIVHRDLKPENIQIDEVAGDADYAKVLDFGIAKIMHGDDEGEERKKTLTMAGAIFGTPHYMSPEQVHGLKIDHRTDIYSLGVILYELLAGVPPFDGATPMSVMMAQASKPIPDIRVQCPQADVNDAVVSLLNDLLCKEPGDRIASCGVLLDRIRDLQFGLGEVSSVGAYTYRRTESGAAIGAPDSIPGHRAPSVSGRESGGLKTPEMTGQMSMPSFEVDAPAPNYGKSGVPKALIAAAAVVGLGVGAFFIFGRPDDKAAAAAAGEAPHRIEINAERIEYTITSTPTGADVFDGETVLGKTPLTKRFVKGTPRKLRVWMPGYEDGFAELSGDGDDQQTHAVTLKSQGQNDRVRPTIAPPAAAWLTVTSRPKGAKVFVDETEIGVTPFDWRPDVLAAPVTLRFEKAGYAATAEQITLAAAGEKPVDVSARLKRTSRRWKPRKKPKITVTPKPKPKITVTPKPKPKITVTPKKTEPVKPEPDHKKPDDSPYQKL